MPIPETNIAIEPIDPHNQALLANVNPNGYVNPRPAEKYNLVVIGAGPAGLVAAAGAAGLGAKVALIERHLMGGDCLNVGCVPSKALIRASRAAAECRTGSEMGIKTGGCEVDFVAVMERLRCLRARISNADSVRRFSELGVDVFIGEGRFCARDSVQAGNETLRFARAMIATGSCPAIPEIPGLAQAGYETNLSIFNLTSLPQRLVVIGGGPIGCELAQAFSRLGSKVTLIQHGKRLLPRDDVDASAAIYARFTSEGMRVLMGAEVASVSTPQNGERLVRCVLNGQNEDIPCDRILVAIGRKVDGSALGLVAAGVDSNASGIVVDDFLRTSNMNIFAAGDCCSRFKFTHAADAMARIVIRNALFFGRTRASSLIIPWCTFTDPEVAQVGVTADEAKLSGLDVEIVSVEMRDNDRAVLDGEEDGFGRLILRRGSDEILGATLVAGHAGDMIGEAALAMTHKLGASKLSSTVHPYPTRGEVWHKLGDAYSRTRLTPRVKRWFAKLMEWRR